jgi:hypothetical protein
MKRSLFLLLAGLIALLAVESGIAQQSATLNLPTYGSGYSEIKTYQEQAMALGGSKQQEISRSILKAKYGEQGVERMFGTDLQNLNISGIEKTIRLAASDNQNQAKGYKRNLIYATKFKEGGEFKVRGLDKNINTRIGNTDIDEPLEHLKTGIKVAVEVKEEKLANQKVDKYKTKILKLADYSKETGEPAVLLSYYELKPEIKDFAEKNGVLPYDKVVTGKLNGQKPGNVRFQDMQDDLSWKLTTDAMKTRVLAGGPGALVGTVLIYTSTKDILANLNSGQRGLLNNIRLTEQVSSDLTGGAFAMEGAGFLFKSKNLMKLGSRYAWPLMITTSVFDIGLDAYQWKQMTKDQKYVALIRDGSNIMLVIAMKVKPPYIAIPLTVIGAGGNLGAYYLNKHYESLEENQKQQVREFIYQHYGVTQ